MANSYTPQFFASISEGSRRSAMKVFPVVFEFVRPKSLIDVGCGAGAWLNGAMQLGVEDVVGIDGDYVERKRLEIPESCFVPLDLTSLSPEALRAAPALLHRRFDLAMSMEVAEHLPESSAAKFVQSLCTLAPVVLFSAALPFQGGNNHLNEQFPSWWAKHFARQGYKPVDCVRRRVWMESSVEWWYRQNTLIFASDEGLALYPALRAAREATPDAALDVIHPAHYERVMSWLIESQRKLVAASL